MTTTTTAQTLGPEDQAAVDAIVATLVHHLRKEHPRPSRQEPARRDAHPKHHGCVPATLEIERNLPEALRQGIFATPGPYKAWVRFSNAFKVRHDLERDARGMAIKVMGVRYAADGEETQDFLLVTHKVFFARTPADFVDLPAAVAVKGSLTLILRTIGFFFGVRPFRFKLRGFIALQRSLNWSTSPLVRTYFSQTPYRYGRSAVKLRARPRQHGWPHQWLRLWIRLPVHWVTSFVRHPVKKWENSLRDEMLAFLRTREAVFDFEVQLREDGMPLDDAVVPWSTRRSAYRKVATLRIKPLSDPDIPTMTAFGEHLSFTPWHGLAEHEPLGSINLARRHVYDAISALRHHLNRVKRREPRAGESQRDYLTGIES
jgi:Catalase